MIDLLVRGGLAFTIPLTVLAAGVLAVAGWAAAGIGEGRAFRRRLVFHLGLFALVFGIFAHAVSLYQMMRAIESVPGVSSAIVAGGLRVSLIAPLFGLAVFLAASLLWLLLDLPRRPASEPISPPP